MQPRVGVALNLHACNHGVPAVLVNVFINQLNSSYSSKSAILLIYLALSIFAKLQEAGLRFQLDKSRPVLGCMESNASC